MMKGLTSRSITGAWGPGTGANNCPYQVRFFNYWEPVWPERLRNQLNTDVTVRSRGVMERCSFCIQRIRRAELTVERQDRSTLDHQTMKERNFLPACVMSCPTNALNFADQSDTTGPVREYFEEANHRLEERHNRTERVEESPTRVYRLLEEMGTKPNVIYLKKVDMFPIKKEARRGS